MILPDPQLVRLHYNSKCERWEVHKGCIVLKHGAKWECRNYCTMHGYTLPHHQQLSTAGVPEDACNRSTNR